MMGKIITSSMKVEKYYLDLCIKLTGRNLELFPHEDDTELAVIDSDTREVLFSSEKEKGWTGGRTFVGAFHEWKRANDHNS